MNTTPALVGVFLFRSLRKCDILIVLNTIYARKHKFTNQNGAFF